MTAGRSLAGQLLRVGRAAGRGAAGGRLRMVALTVATLTLAVTLLSAVAAYATYEQRTERGAARTHVLQLGDGQDAHDAPLLMKQHLDDVHDRQVQVVFVQPTRPDAPVPPGVKEWPAPGEALLSPALAADGVGDRYGRDVGRIGPEGLASPDERFAYARPADGELSVEHALLATGFGADGAAGLGDVANIKPLSVFLQLLICMLGLPAALFTVVAARLGAEGRDRRVALLGALGGSRSQLALLTLGEAAPALLLGTLLAVPLLVCGLLVDLRIPWVGYTLAADDMYAYLWPLTAALFTAPLLVAALTVLMHRWSGPGRSTRPRAEGRSRPVKVSAALCPVFLGVLSWSPSALTTYGPSTSVVLLSLLGTVGALATLPAACAVLLTLAGRAVTRWGRRHGYPGALLAGRWMQGRPGYLSRLVAGVVVAVGLLSIVQVYPSMHSASVQGAITLREQFDHSVLTLRLPRGAEHRADAWLRTVPDGAKTVVLDSTLGLANGGGEVTAEPHGEGRAQRAATVRGSCPALTGLGLKCPAKGETRTARLATASPALRALIPASVSRIGVTRGPVRARENSVLVVYSPDGRNLPLGTLKRDALVTLGPGALVEAVGQSWIGGAVLLSSQLRWVTLLGATGVALVALAAALNSLAEVMRFARSIAPVTMVTGSRRIYAVVAAWTLAAPLCAAAVLGAVSAVWVTLPYTVPPRNGQLPPQLLGAVVTVLVVLAIAVTGWAARSAVRQAQRWRPRHD